MEICFATHNQNKLQELTEMLPDTYLVKSLTDLGQTDEIPETGATLQQNSELKARFVANKYGIAAFADDTGLEVEALNGAPGVYSARYAGSQKNAHDNIALLLKNLNGQPNRRAQFRTSICLIINNQTVFFDGIVKGHITAQPIGQGGFGYDPVFVPDGHSQTFAQLNPQQKNRISHRGLAVQKLVNYLQSF